MNMEAQSLIIVGLILITYFAPTWIAKKGRRGSIFVLNLLLGWTGIVWAIALYMAVRSNEPKETP
jgi:membrane protein CcdC involved in cytochrome C biogenesis